MRRKPEEDKPMLLPASREIVREIKMMQDNFLLCRSRVGSQNLGRQLASRRELSTDATLAYSWSAAERAVLGEAEQSDSVTAAPDSVWNAHDAVDCNCSNLTLYLSAVFGCITQNRD